MAVCLETNEDTLPRSTGGGRKKKASSMSDRLEAVKVERAVNDDVVWAYTIDREFSVFGSELTDTSPCGKAVQYSFPAEANL